MEDQQIIDEITPKKGRHRKKLLYSSLKALMEFYFSDVNLSKDRLLAQLIQKDPFIELSIFLKFNKVRHLTNKISDLCKAISTSEVIMLSEDNLKVCRTTPIRVKENEDECTIYVERLPADTEHDWLKNAFSKFGPVDYVSIPRYKQNKMLKGFAFIEFAAPETAKKALEYFESIDCKLPTSMLPDHLASISSFESEKSDKKQNILNQFTTKLKTTEYEREITENMPKNDTSDSKTKVKRKEPDDQTETNEVKKKKLDQEMEIEHNELEQSKTKEVDEEKTNKQKQGTENEQINESVEVEEGKKDNHKQNVENEQVNKTVEETKNKEKEKQKKSTENEQIIKTDEVAEIESNEIKKKEMKQEKLNMELENNDKVEATEKQEECIAEDVSVGKKRRKRKKCKSNSSDLQQYGLQVLSKKEWMQLRNKYLNLQRQKIQNLKQHLHRSRFANVQNNLENAADKNQSENLNFTPGAIVHITLPDTFNDFKKLKNDIRSQPGFQYIDVKIGSNVGYIRFSDNSTAIKFCENGYINSDLVILKGNDEKEYWENISQNREEKFKKYSNKKQRGRDKLLRKAEKELGKHIKFENAE